MFPESYNVLQGRISYFMERPYDMLQCSFQPMICSQEKILYSRTKWFITVEYMLPGAYLKFFIYFIEYKIYSHEKIMCQLRRSNCSLEYALYKQKSLHLVQIYVQTVSWISINVAPFLIHRLPFQNFDKRYRWQ